MHILIVTAHPDVNSLTHAIAAQVEDAGLATCNITFEFAHLAQEGFDPRFNEADLGLYRRQTSPPADVTAEQARIERADSLVLIYPIYWWSMPALLKGWIDRVFSNGWAFEFDKQGVLTKRLNRLHVHLLGIGAADASTYDKYSYTTAMTTQIDHGIFGYCGAKVDSSEVLFESETSGQILALEAAKKLGESLRLSSNT